MADSYQTGDEVWVPSRFLTVERPYALERRKIVGRVEIGRSVLIEDRDEPRPVATRNLHHNTLGFLVLRVGDFHTERTLLDPLAKSVLQYLRLLIADDVVHTLNARTKHELSQYMSTNGATLSHIVVLVPGQAGNPRIHEFAGALLGKQGDRGVFITTSSFSRGAIDEAERINARIELIDGARLAELLVSYDVGVQAEHTVVLYRLDEDFFESL